MKPLKLLVHPDTKLRAKVELTPLGDKIKYRIYGKVMCRRMECEMIKSQVFHRDDFIWLNVFRTKNEIARFLKKNKKINKIIYINQLGYDTCDYLV